MPDFREHTLDRIGVDAAAVAMDEVFKEYLVPMSWTPEAFERHVRTNDSRLDLSPVWYDERGGVVATALLALRGAKAWIGGFGVAPAYRKRGLGSALLATVLENARAANAREIALEVLDLNRPAIATYERGGFASMRRLISIAGKPDVSADALPAYDVAAALDSVPYDDACWQNQRASMDHRKHDMRALGDASAFIAYVPTPAKARASTCVTNARDLATFSRLAAAVCAREHVDLVSIFNECDSTVLGGIAQRLDWKLEFSVLEMKRSL